MAVAHDETRADAADAEALALGQTGEVVELQVQGHEQTPTGLFKPQGDEGALGIREGNTPRLEDSPRGLGTSGAGPHHALTRRSSRGKGKLTCSSRTVRVSTVAPKRARR